MKWSDAPTCHAGERRYSTGPIVWRPPSMEPGTAGDGSADTYRSGSATPWRTCNYCGSMHPEDLLALDARLRFDEHVDIRTLDDAAFQAAMARPHLELADMKYGWPHKVYVTTHELLHPDVDFVYSCTMTGGGVVPGSVKTRRGYPAHGKFYVEHAEDGDDEALAALSALLDRTVRVSLQRDDGRLKWRRR